MVFRRGAAGDFTDIGERTHGCGSDFQNCRHRHPGGGVEPAAGPLRPGGAGHDDDLGGAGGGLDDDGPGDQRPL